jgi:hypothetical protein
MTRPVINLAQAVEELRAYNQNHPFNLVGGIMGGLKMSVDEYYRTVMHKGEIFHIGLTKIPMEGNVLWMLAIAKPSGKVNSYGAYLPEDAEAVEIAETFFPKGCTALTNEDQIVPPSCRKFMVIERKEQK